MTKQRPICADCGSADNSRDATARQNWPTDASFQRHETLSQYKWRGQKIRDGQPITDLPFCNLNEAAAYVCPCC